MESPQSLQGLHAELLEKCTGVMNAVSAVEASSLEPGRSGDASILVSGTILPGGAPTIPYSPAETLMISTRSKVDYSQGLADMHRDLVEDWDAHLADVYESAAYIHFRGNTVPRGFARKILRMRLDAIDLTSLEAMQRTLAAALKKEFGHLPYDQKIHLLCALFGIDHERLPGRETLKKHWIVRGINVHSRVMGVRGVVRSEDLDKLSRRAIELYDEGGNPQCFAEGERLVMYPASIRELCTAIEQCSGALKEIPS